MVTEHYKKYQKEYKKTTIKKIQIEFNMNVPNDVELYEWMLEQGNKQNLIKRLLQEEKERLVKKV